MKVYFIGAGPGDPELITLKGKRIIGEADVIVYAGSLINPDILHYRKKNSLIYDSAVLSLDQFMGIMIESVKKGSMVARIHSGDPSIFGAIQEQIEILKMENIEYEIIPGVSSFLAAAAALKSELTIPELSQTIIITRMEGRTGVPETERIEDLARHKTTMAIFLSISLVDKVEKELLSHYSPDTPVAVVYKVSWPDQLILKGELINLSKIIKDNNITKTALIIIGKCLNGTEQRSKLYDKEFGHEYRKELTNQESLTN